MAGIVTRAGTYWKAAAGCAICASLIAGIIEDARHWLRDHTVGFWSTEEAWFETWLSRHLADTPRPAQHNAFRVLVTIPEGDDDLTRFRLIERSLTRAQGETRSAPVQVEALVRKGLHPAGGLVAELLERTQARVQALLVETGADVADRGEALVPGEVPELRFSGRPTVQKPADYQANGIVLTADFRADLGALVAARALTSVRDLFGPTMDRQRERADLAITITAPLVENQPPACRMRLGPTSV